MTQFKTERERRIELAEFIGRTLEYVNNKGPRIKYDLLGRILASNSTLIIKALEGRKPRNNDRDT